MKIISIVNQKGGVGKTTTVLNIAVGLANQGKKVLCIDLDPQANLSDYLSYDFNSTYTITDLFKNALNNSQSIDYSKAVQVNETEGIDYIPSDITLASADMFLSTAMCRESILKRILQKDYFNKYDFILIDCLPSLGILVTNALTASDGVIIPVQAQKFALNGIIQFEDIFNIVKNEINPQLQIIGVLETMVDNTNMAKAVDSALKERYGELVFKSVITKRVEATNSTYSRTSLINDKSSTLGVQYSMLVDELLLRSDY